MVDFKRSTFETILIRLLSGMQWKKILTDPDNGYEGKHTDKNASTTDTDWYIWKRENGHEQGPLIGAWSDRKTLEWGDSEMIGIQKDIQNYELQSLMEEVVKQQKITNAYLSLIANEEIGEEDVRCR